MSYAIKILPKADMEYSDAAIWYEEQKAGLGNSFINSVEVGLKRIARFPEKYPIRKEKFRETLVDVFPYTIVFTIHEEEKVITVSSIFHTSRNPQKKYRK